jgi:transketolase
VISDTQLMTLRKHGSVIEGHPTPRLPYVEVATGSLDQELAVAVGMALAAKRLDRVEDRFWVLLGDSEMAEGSIYESLELEGSTGSEYAACPAPRRPRSRSALPASMQTPLSSPLLPGY